MRRCKSNKLDEPIAQSWHRQEEAEPDPIEPAKERLNKVRARG
jgi:hypothetical protein